MSNILKALMAGKSNQVYVDDVFSTYLYTGTGAALDIVNGIDLDYEGGMVWIKSRSAATGHSIHDTLRGPTYYIRSETTSTSTLQSDSVTSFNSDGFTLGVDVGANRVNLSGQTYASWTFRNTKNFFKVLQETKAAGVDKIIDLSQYMKVVGMVKVKRTDAAGSWYVWHRSLTAGKLLIGETTAAETTLGHITVSGTTLTLVDGTIANGDYHIECYAHDDSANGFIQCGAFNTDASRLATIGIGWEPQYVLLKQITPNAEHWWVLDSIRGVITSGNDSWIESNSSAIEQSSNSIDFTSNGFNATGALENSATYIYMAIRRPNKPPESGADVYSTSLDAGVIASGFVTDLHIGATLAGAVTNHRMHSRLTGGTKELVTNSTAAESNVTDVEFDVMDGLGVSFAASLVNHFFKRVPGFMDVVCYTGTSVAHTESHNLTVIPELIIVKSRSLVGEHWAVYYGDNTKYLQLDDNIAPLTLSTAWNNTDPTGTQFTIGTSNISNGSTVTYVAYLFATLAGVSYVGSLTKVADANLDVDCGFSAGARFVLLKRTDDVGDWYIWDSVRGIVAGDDPYLLLNTTAAQVTNTDYIDPLAAGFTIVDNGLADGDYICLAIA